MAYNPTDNIKNDNQDKGFLFHFLKWLLIIALAVTTLSLLTKPLRKNWSNDYVAKGDVFLEQKRYVTADLQYKKALILFSKNEVAEERISLCKNAQTDILLLDDFIRSRNTSAQIELFDLATIVPKDEVEAVKNSKELIEKEEYQLAAVAAETATKMDPEYREGWLYLGIADLKVAQNSEMLPENLDNYRSIAKQNLEKALSLDPTYQITQDYLKQAQ